MATVSPSEILRKDKKSRDTDDDGPSQKTRMDKQGDEHDEKMPAKKGKRNALVDFIAKCKKTAA